MDEIYSLPIYGSNQELLFVDSLANCGFSVNHRYGLEQVSPSGGNCLEQVSPSEGNSLQQIPSSEENSLQQTPPSKVDRFFLEDLVDMFFCSFNKYVASLLARQLSEWAYQLANGSYERKVLLPRMLNGRMISRGNRRIS